MRRIKHDPPEIADFKTKVALIAAILVAPQEKPRLKEMIDIAIGIIDAVDVVVNAELAETPRREGL